MIDFSGYVGSCQSTLYSRPMGRRKTPGGFMWQRTASPRALQSALGRRVRPKNLGRAVHEAGNVRKFFQLSLGADPDRSWYNGRRGGRLSAGPRIAGTCARRSRFIFFALTARHVEQRFASICILRASSARNVPNHQTTASFASRRGSNGP